MNVMIKKILLFAWMLTVFAACSDKDDDKEPEVFNRTVLVYISGENSLNSFINDELRQLQMGSKGIGSNALLIYVDAAKTSELPYIARIKEGKAVDSVALFKDDVISSDPEVMGTVLQYASNHYPAKDYGLVLWGHASGWLMEDSIPYTEARRAYGIDNGANSGNDHGKWINMGTLAKVIGNWGHPLRFIMADCCQFQCIESAYELRNVTNYIIGSPAEIPGEGAPYHTMTKELFGTSEDFYLGIVDAYYAQTADGYRVPLSVIATDRLEQLAWATGNALADLGWTADNCPNLYGRIHYRGKGGNEIMYDMNDIMKHYLPEEDYKEWHTAFDSVVVHKTFAKKWMTNGQMDFSSFQMAEDTYGGVSMFVPQRRPGTQYTKYNQDIRKTAWYWAARLNELGW